MLHPPLLCAPPLGAALLPPQALLLSGDPVITQSHAIPMQFVCAWIDCKFMDHLLVLAHAARPAVHVVLASLLLLACSILAMLYCACSRANYAMLCLVMTCLCSLVYHACLSRCTCVASVTLVCVPEVPVICFSATPASQ